MIVDGKYMDFEHAGVEEWVETWERDATFDMRAIGTLLINSRFRLIVHYYRLPRLRLYVRAYRYAPPPPSPLIFSAYLYW